MHNILTPDKEECESASTCQSTTWAIYLLMIHSITIYSMIYCLNWDKKNRNAKFRVFRMGGSNEVYLYEEKHSHVQVVGKFFAGNGHGGSHLPEKEQKMQQEFSICT